MDPKKPVRATEEPKMANVANGQRLGFAVYCAVAVMAVAASVLVGWAFDIPALKSVVPGYITMKANTAFCFVFLAAALLAVCDGHASPARKIVGLSLSGLTIVLALTTLLEYLLDRNFGIDELIFSDPGGVAGTFPPGRLAPITAINFILFSVSFVLIALPRPLYRASQFLVGLAFIISLQAFVGYAIGLTYLFGAAFYTQMALHTTVAFIILSVGILASQRNQGFVEAFTSGLPSSAMVRKILIAIILSPILIRWVAIQGLRFELYNQDFSVLIQVVGSIIVMGVILIGSAGALYEAEKEREEARSRAEFANRAKTNFIANISHELRTPLGAVLGFSELLATEDSSDHERDTLSAAIKRNGDQLLRLIDDLLDISKIEAGQLRIEKSRFSLAVFLNDVVALARLKAEQKEMEVSVEYLTGLPEIVYSDSARLRQVLLNVIGNGVKFNRAHGKVCLSVEFLPRATPLLRFTIRDNGPGIAASASKHLFEPFHQADDSLTRKFGGTGLGLALSKKIAQALGGDLRLSPDRPVVGSAFEIDIDPGPLSELRLTDLSAPPVVASPTPPKSAVAPDGVHANVAAKVAPGVDSVGTSAEAVSTETPHEVNLEGIHVLLVEDSSDNQALVKRFLRSSGAQIETANDGIEGVEKALHGKFDIVLMDLQMPNLDGYDAIKRLRGIGYRVPIVALTAHALREDRERCFKVGFAEHLTKPINKRQLLHTIEAFVTPITNHA